MSEVNSKIIIALLAISIMSFLANLGFLFCMTRQNITIQLVQPVSNEGEVPVVYPKEFE